MLDGGFNGALVVNVVLVILSEENQSPSSTLLNWLWGKSGPKSDQ